jgi:hypothetical protein
VLLGLVSSAPSSASFFRKRIPPLYSLFEAFFCTARTSKCHQKCRMLIPGRKKAATTTTRAPHVIPSDFAASGCSWGQLPTALYNQKSKHPALPSPLHLTHTTLKPHPQTTAFSSPVRAIKLQSTTTTHTHNTMSAESWCAGSFCPCVDKRSATIFTAGPDYLTRSRRVDPGSYSRFASSGWIISRGMRRVSCPLLVSRYSQRAWSDLS